MHEYSAVQQLIERLLQDISGHETARIKEVRLRRGSTFAEGPIQQAFQIMAANTPLEDTLLTIEEFSVENKCEQCGHKRVLTPDDLIGHLYICPECGNSREIDEAHGLQLLEIIYSET